MGFAIGCGCDSPDRALVACRNRRGTSSRPDWSPINIGHGGAAHPARAAESHRSCRGHCRAQMPPPARRGRGSRRAPDSSRADLFRAVRRSRPRRTSSARLLSRNRYSCALVHRSVTLSGIGLGFDQMMSWRRYQPSERSAKARSQGMPIRSFGLQPGGSVAFAGWIAACVACFVSGERAG
jgi:hypothetical protein